MDKQTPKKKRRGRRRSPAPIIAMAIIILILLAIIAYLILGGTDKPGAQKSEIAPTPTAEALQLEIDPNAGELITPTPAPTEPGVAIPGWGSITLPAGVTEAAASLRNPEANAGWYYLTFELRLKDTDEVLFTTGLVPPGQYCNAVTLTRALEPGEYAAVVHVQPYRISDQSPTNNADMETILIVQ